MNYFLLVLTLVVFPASGWAQKKVKELQKEFSRARTVEKRGELIVESAHLKKEQKENNEKERRISDQAWKDINFGFPCPELIAKKTSKTKIVLSGEQHGNFYCQTAECAKTDDAKNQKCLLALEARYCASEVLQQLPGGKTNLSIEQDGLFGYDDPFIHGLSLMLVGHSDFEAQEERKNIVGLIKTKKDFMVNLSVNNYAKQAWKKVRDANSPFQEESQEAIAKVFDSFLSQEVPDALLSLNRLRVNHPWVTDQKAFRSLIHESLRSYVKIAKSPEHIQKHLVPENLERLIESHIQDEDPETTEDIVLVEWRNQFMARNIAKIYCQALEADKDLYVITGKDHVPGLKTLLDKMSNGRVPPVETEDAIQVGKKLAKEQGLLPAQPRIFILEIQLNPELK